MSNKRKIKQRTQKRLGRVRHAIKSVATEPRICVFRSLKHIYAQLINSDGNVMASSSSLALKEATGDKKTVAYTVGQELAKRAEEKGIKAVVLDRGSYLYHGRVQALAEGLREGGLKI